MFQLGLPLIREAGKAVGCIIGGKETHLDECRLLMKGMVLDEVRASEDRLLFLVLYQLVFLAMFKHNKDILLALPLYANFVKLIGTKGYFSMILEGLRPSSYWFCVNEGRSPSTSE